jgi:GTPase SAR1 family protein
MSVWLLLLLQIWNTYQQMARRRISDAYFVNARGALLLFDTSDRAAFVNSRNWLSHLRNKGGAHMQVGGEGGSGSSVT